MHHPAAESPHLDGVSLTVRDEGEVEIRVPSRAFGDRGFWIVFVAAWLAYAGLGVAMASLENEPINHILVLIPVPMVVMAMIGWRRRDLVTAERTQLHTTGILFGVGVVHCIVSGIVGTGLLASFAPNIESLWIGGPVVLAVKLTVYNAVLFVIFAAFLLWSESVERIQESRAIAAQAAVLRARAEAKALRAQFNPHFVFNTLHSLMLLVREDPTTAERAIEDVAELIRYASTLERLGQDTVSLSREIEVARKYLALEALRLEERLQVAWDVDPELEDAVAPAFSLQTLLENAIKHGLSPKPEGGRITVKVTGDGPDMVLHVEDDGAGADPAAAGSREGSGLDLLERRLRGLYGDAASLEWHTAPGKGFSVTLRWPRSATGAPEKDGNA